MVDTIRLASPCSKNLFNRLRDFAVLNNQKITLGGNTIEFFKTLVNLPSYQRGISIFVVNTRKEDKKIYIEFSVPKLILGNNVMMINSAELNNTVKMIHSQLSDIFQDFPPLKDFQLQRLDICYNWFTHSEYMVQEYISALKGFGSKRKNRSDYGDRGFEDVGSRYTIKFYDKYQEFKKHDYKEIAKYSTSKFLSEDNGKLAIDEGSANLLLEMSKGCLRFETELRKKQLQYELKTKDLSWSNLDITDDVLKSLLNKYLFRFIEHLSNISMTQEKMIEILNMRYGSEMTTKLLGFYSLKRSKKYLKSLSRSSLSKYRKMLREAGIGIKTKSNLPKLEIN